MNARVRLTLLHGTRGLGVHEHVDHYTAWIPGCTVEGAHTLAAGAVGKPWRVVDNDPRIPAWYGLVVTAEVEVACSECGQWYAGCECGRYEREHTVVVCTLIATLPDVGAVVPEVGTEEGL